MRLSRIAIQELCLKAKVLMFRTVEKYNLKIINPHLAKEWHSVKNGNLSPQNVMPGSQKKAWWTCRKGHEWQARISHRSKGAGCPYCSGRKADINTCLPPTNPSLAPE